MLTYYRNPTVRNFDGFTSVGDSEETDNSGFQPEMEEREDQEEPGEESMGKSLVGAQRR